MGNFFIARPVFAWVLAILTMLAGALAVVTLPVSQSLSSSALRPFHLVILMPMKGECCLCSLAQCPPRHIMVAKYLKNVP